MTDREAALWKREMAEEKGKKGDAMTTTTKAIENVRRSNGYREGEGDLWLGTALHEIEDEHREIVAAARKLIREIQKRDGEGNVIPSHTYFRLACLIGVKL
jgi:hypothetical protein